jgi:hypothetical protein
MFDAAAVERGKLFAGNAPGLFQDGLDRCGIQFSEQAIFHVTGKAGYVSQSEGNIGNWRSIGHQSSR